MNARTWISLTCMTLLGCGGGYARHEASGMAPEEEPEGTPGEYEVRIGEMQTRLDAVLGRAPAGVQEEQAAEPAEAEPPAAPPTTGGEALYAPAPEAEALLDADAEAAAVDCDVAGDLRDRICELSARICAIAAEHPDDAVVEGQCERGRGACERARRNVSVDCPDS